MEAQVFFAGGFFLGVFFHPGFPGFAGGSVASGEGQGGDVGVGDGNFFVGILRVQADLGIFQRGGGAAVEEVAFDLGSVFAGDGDVAAVVEGFFEGLAEFFFGGEGGDPAFEFLVLGAGGDFERVGIGRAGGCSSMWPASLPVMCFSKSKSSPQRTQRTQRELYARVSCSSCDDAVDGAIWISGFTGACGSSSMRSASSSL